jgi:hypothetical protein
MTPEELAALLQTAVDNDTPVTIDPQAAADLLTAMSPDPAPYTPPDVLLGEEMRAWLLNAAPATGATAEEQAYFQGRTDGIAQYAKAVRDLPAAEIVRRLMVPNG